MSNVFITPTFIEKCIAYAVLHHLPHRTVEIEWDNGRTYSYTFGDELIWGVKPRTEEMVRFDIKWDDWMNQDFSETGEETVRKIDMKAIALAESVKVLTPPVVNLTHS